MVKYADLLICVSKNIVYGADTKKSTMADDDQKLIEWYKEKELSHKYYYLVVRITLRR